MKTSLNDIRLIENYILQRQDDGDALVFEAKKIIDPEWNTKIFWQQKSYAAIRQYGRKKLKAEIESVHRKLFSHENLEHESFRKKIIRLFSNI